MILFDFNVKEMLADLITPVSIYLKLRDQFPGTVLLESSDYHASKDASSFIAFDPIASIKLQSGKLVTDIEGEVKELEQFDIAEDLKAFVSNFDLKNREGISKPNAIFGYTSYDAVRHFETVDISKEKPAVEIPEMWYQLYRYIIQVNHFNNSIKIIELVKDKSEESKVEKIAELISGRDIPSFKFKLDGEESSNMDDEEYIELVKKGKAHCRRGDLFQIVLSRRFSQKYKGDDFNLYRALRSINPSPYLYYFDYGSFRLMGSSPESQFGVEDGVAYINPIAGTFKRTGDADKDAVLADQLIKDPKELSEHVMLVDLARNDLSRYTTGIKVEKFREIQYFSHVIHLVSKVSGQLPVNYNPFRLMANTFPAGTLSGAPKIMAMNLIDKYEPTSRGFYGGAIGALGFDGYVNLAIMIRSFLSKDNQLYYQAGAGVVEKSVEINELNEVKHKLAALRSSIKLAKEI